MCIHVKKNMTRSANEKIREIDMGICGPPIKISHDLCCKNIVYVAKDLVHGKVYVGQTGREIKRRHANHLGDILRGDIKKPVSRYFMDKNLDEQDFWMAPVAQIRGSRVAREYVESAIIRRYNTTTLGLNTRI